MQEHVEDEEVEEESVNDQSGAAVIDYSKRLKSQLKLPFPSLHHAETVMRTIGVDPAFTDTATRKTTIQRQMWIEEFENEKVVYLNVLLSCDPAANDGTEVGSLRTAISSLTTNVKLAVETLKAFAK